MLTCPFNIGIFGELASGVPQQGGAHAARHQQGGPYSHLCMDVIPEDSYLCMVDIVCQKLPRRN